MKRIFALLLVIAMLSVCGCAKDNANEANKSDFIEADMLKMKYVIDGLVFAELEMEYDSTNTEFVWKAIAYTVSTYGYGIYDGNTAVQKKPVSNGHTTLTKQEMEYLVKAMFGNSMTVPEEGYEEYFAFSENSYRLKDTVDFTPISVKLSNFSEVGKLIATQSKLDRSTHSIGVNFEHSEDKDSPFPYSIRESNHIGFSLPIFA